MKKTILIISFSNLKNDPRVYRHILFLKEHYRVITAGLADPEVAGVEFILCTRTKKSVFSRAIKAFLLFTKQYPQFYWFPGYITEIFDSLSSVQADLVLANDIETLPLAIRLAKVRGAKIIFDAHEYAPREFERLWWKILFQSYRTGLCSTYIPQVNGMITVCQGIADQYGKDTGIQPVVITNAADNHKLEPNLRPDGDQVIRLIHHGSTNPDRKIEHMIRVMDYLDERFTLDLLLVPNNPEYLAKLKKQAQPNSRIRFLQPVPMHDLVSFAHHYDIGLYLLHPSSFNNLHALPNKFFEFIQSRLAIAIGPSPEMAKIVQTYDCGVVSKDFTPRSLAKCLMQLDHTKINSYKQQAHNVAKIMSAEQNRVILLDLVARVLRGEQT